jgi:hypothetical protein
MTSDHSLVRPPAWAEALLRLLLAPKDRDSVSGDLLEQYRATVLPARGGVAADWWYVRQVGSFVWRGTWPWALIFSGAFVVRNAYDWLVPTTDFHVRSGATTYFAITTLLLVGFYSAWRSGSAIAGILLTIIASQIAAVFSVVGSSVLLAILKSPEIDRAIAGSGGIDEVYALPFMMIVPAVILGTISGIVGRVSRMLVRG